MLLCTLKKFNKRPEHRKKLAEENIISNDKDGMTCDTLLWTAMFCRNQLATQGSAEDWLSAQLCTQ